MNEPHEVSYWTEKFGLTQEELQKVIDRTGSDSAATVEKALNTQ
jgi:3-oxoacyl-[acyl-carrier-protein] synthase III